jgi:hypothetical protein
MGASSASASDCHWHPPFKSVTILILLWRFAHVPRTLLRLLHSSLALKFFPIPADAGKLAYASSWGSGGSSATALSGTKRTRREEQYRPRMLNLKNFNLGYNGKR